MNTPAAMPVSPIVFLVKGFPRLSETFVLHEFLELRRQGLDLRIVSVLQPTDTLVHPDAIAVIPEVTYLRNSSPRLTLAALVFAIARPVGFGRLCLWLLRQHSVPACRRFLDACLLARHAHELEATHIHAHFASVPTTTAYLARKLTGITYSFSAHAKDIYTGDPAALLLRANAATFAVTCTQANADYFTGTVGTAPGKVIPMRHGIPVERFTAAVPARVPGRVLTVGRLVPKKGLDTVIEALGILRDRGVGFSWHLAGSGPLRSELTAQVASIGLTDRVVFLGSVTSGEVLLELTEASVFVMSPRVLPDGDRDGIPNVLLEAMAAGVPVVATAISGIPEVIESGVRGALVRPDSPAELADAIEAALLDPAAREQATAARAWTVEHCALPQAVAPLAALLRAAAHQSNP